MPLVSGSDFYRFLDTTVRQGTRAAREHIRPGIRVSQRVADMVSEKRSEFIRVIVLLRLDISSSQKLGDAARGQLSTCLTL